MYSPLKKQAAFIINLDSWPSTAWLKSHFSSESSHVLIHASGQNSTSTLFAIWDIIAALFATLQTRKIWKWNEWVRWRKMIYLRSFFSPCHPLDLNLGLQRFHINVPYCLEYKTTRLVWTKMSSIWMVVTIQIKFNDVYTIVVTLWVVSICLFWVFFIPFSFQPS